MEDFAWEIYGSAAGVIIVLIYYGKKYGDMYSNICKAYEEYRNKKDDKDEARLKEMIAVLQSKLYVDEKQAEAYEKLEEAFKGLELKIDNFEKSLNKALN